MIARFWTAKTSQDQAAVYTDHLWLTITKKSNSGSFTTLTRPGD